MRTIKIMFKNALPEFDIQKRNMFLSALAFESNLKSNNFGIHFLDSRKKWPLHIDI